MTLILGYKLPYFSIPVLQTLFKYRGMDAIQITNMLYPLGYTLSQEKIVYNNLSKLKKNKLVDSRKLQDGFSQGSIYFLTEKGLDFVNHLLNIPEGEKGDGWIRSDYSSFGDIPYGILKPPLDQTTHHLLTIELFIELNKHEHLNLDYRLNLYASSTYFVNGQKFRFRPDAEIKLNTNDKRILVEIDRGTENHEQLRRKFRVYRHYFDYLSTNNTENFPYTILFVVEDKRRSHGIKRRWTNIVSAYLNEIGPYHDRVNLVMTTISKAKETLEFELNRLSYEKQSRKLVYDVLSSFAYKKILSSQKGELINLAFNDESYDIYLNSISQEFETSIYSRYLNFKTGFLNKLIQAKETKDLLFNGLRTNLLYLNEIPVVIERMEYPIDDEWKEVFREFKENNNSFKLES